MHVLVEVGNGKLFRLEYFILNAKSYCIPHNKEFAVVLRQYYTLLGGASLSFLHLQRQKNYSGSEIV